jgi:ankyrin repeat protein
LRLALFAARFTLIFVVCLHAANEDGDLLAAAKYGNRPAVEKAIKAGACVSIRDAHGRTPLVWAAAGGYSDVVRLLLEQGFNDGLTAMTFAAANGHIDVTRELLTRRPAFTESVLKTAISAGHANEAALLAREKALSLTLISAAKEGDVKRTRELLSQGAAVNYYDSDGGTPLTPSVEGPIDAAVFRLLLEKGADPWLRIAGRTVRERIGDRLQQQSLILLARAESAYPEEQLREAVRSGETTKVAGLLCRGADPNLSDNSNRSALVYAAMKRDLIMVRLLLSRGAKTGMEMAARVAQEGGHPEIAAALNQPRANDFMIDDVMKALRIAIQNAASGETAPIVKAHFRAEKAYRDLDGFVEKWFGASGTRTVRRGNGDQEYFGGLMAGAMELDRAVKTRNAAEIARILAALAEDMETKAEHCRKSGGLRMEVKLLVHTLRGGEEVRNWQVLYLSKIFEFLKDARPEVFPIFSSPSTETVPPGRYLIWARDPKSGRDGVRTAIKVGEGSAEMRVDVPVP